MTFGMKMSFYIQTQNMMYDKIIDKLDFIRMNIVSSVKDRECQENEKMPQTEGKYLQMQVRSRILIQIT